MNSNKINTTATRRNRFGQLSFLTVAFMLVLALGASNALAKGGYQDGGGFSGPGPAVVTVEQAKGMNDDAKVALRGYIVQSLGGDDYLFRDSTGEIRVDIDRKKWNGQKVGPEDLVEIHGEIDKDWGKVEIEVDRIIKQ